MATKCSNCGTKTTRRGCFCASCHKQMVLLGKAEYRRRSEFYHPYKLSTGTIIYLNENAACSCYQADKLTDAEWEEYEAIKPIRQPKVREGMSWEAYLLVGARGVL